MYMSLGAEPYSAGRTLHGAVLDSVINAYLDSEKGGRLGAGRHVLAAVAVRPTARVAIDSASRRCLQAAVRIDDEFLRHTRIELRIAARCIVEIDDGYVDDFGDVQPIPQNRLH